MDTSHLQKRLQEFISSASRPLIVILGATASGKTDFSLDLAHLLGSVEIINADSRQLYRHLDIGTAKIREEEMRGIPHHLIDVLDPKEDVTAMWFRDQAVKTIDDIQGRGKIPILVGGSMLYISAVTDDLEFPAERSLRQSLQARKNRKPNDHHFIIGIERPREEIVKRINERTKKLLSKGWIDEVRELITQGYTPDDPGMMSHGYREIMEFLKSGKTDTGALAEEISAKTRQYAKRQMTWWKNDPRIQWIKL